MGEEEGGVEAGRGGGVVGEMGEEETVQNAATTTSTVGRSRGRGRSLVRGRGVGNRGKLSSTVGGGPSSDPKCKTWFQTENNSRIKK